MLVLLDGAGMRLTEAGGRVRSLDAPLALAHFAGETPIRATLDDGPTRDFNVMVRHDRACATVEVHRGPASVKPRHDLTFIFCTSGRIDIKLDDNTRHTINSGDTLSLDKPAACEVREDGSWLHIGIESGSLVAAHRQ